MSRTDEHLYKICLTALGRPRVVVPIGPDESTASLYERAAAEFRASVTALHSGVPPRLLPAHPHELVRSRIDNNARVIVTLAPSSAAAAATTATTTTTTTTTTTGRSSQRAAAKAATDSFAAVIAAQDAQDAATTSRSRRTQNAPASATGSAASAAKKLAKLPGRRLIDGATIEARTTNSTTGNSRTSRNNHSNSNSNKSSKRKMNSEEDVSTALLTALNHGGGGKVGQVLRGAMRNAVTHTYNASIALVRVAAVQANKYTITNNNNSNNNSLHVTFSKMTQGRGDYEEDVDYIPLDALQQVISAIHQSDPESLRPITLAQLSPRVFWSLLYHHRDEMASSGGNSTTNNIEHAYTTLLPNLNWAFLKKRKLTLSDKAKENLRQQQQQQQQQLGTTEEDAENNNNNNNNMQAAQDAIQAVEHAMDSLHAYNADQRRNNAAQAALARATMTMNHHPTVDTATTTTTTTWELVTPTEEDRDELIACIGDDYQSNDGTVVDQLLRLQIYNWRMLANCTSSDLSKLLQQIPETTIDAWLDRAQQESIDEIMVEICNGNVQAVEALRDEAKSGTPKDLANWRMIPDMLLAATPSLQKVVSVPTLAEWCQRSHELLQQYSWLNWYATPVE